MKDDVSRRWTLTRMWRKRLFWSLLTMATISVCFLLAKLQGKEEAVFSLAGNIIASALIGIVLLLFWGKWLRRNAFFPAEEVSSFLKRNKLSSDELAKYEAHRYNDILNKITKKHLEKYPQKKVFSFLLMGPEQSGKTCFSRFVNGNCEFRREFFAQEVPYAVVAGNPAALDEVFRWLCDGDEGDRLKCRIIVFHAGNSVRQVNELVEKMRIVQERFRKIGGDEEAAVHHKILLMVQFTGRRPLEAISADFKWNEVLDDVFVLNYISPDWIAKECSKRKDITNQDFARDLYLHSLGIPEWYNTLSNADTVDKLFSARHAYLERWFREKDDEGQPLDFLKCILRVRNTDMLPFRFLANTFLLEKIYGRDSKLSNKWESFLHNELPAMDIVNGRAAVKACGEKFFGPLCEAFLLYHGFLPTVSRKNSNAEKRTIREILEWLLVELGTWDATSKMNVDYLRRRLLIEFCVPFFPYLSMCGVRLNDELTKMLRDRLFECVQTVIEESDADYAEMALALMIGMKSKGPYMADLRRLSNPAVVKLTEVLSIDETEEQDPALAWAPRFKSFVSLCDTLYPDRLSQMAENFFSYAGHQLYQAFMRSKIGRLQSFHLLGGCIQEFRRLACRSQNALLINKLVELETLRLSFSSPTRYDDVGTIVDDYLTDKYAFFHDSKDFLQCRSWLRKTLCSEQLAKESQIKDLSLPEYVDGWQKILHPSELWMANHAIQQAFLLSKYNNEIPKKKVQMILDDLLRRLHWYCGYREITGESLPIVFANELLFAQINFLSYRHLIQKEPQDGNWRKLFLDSKMEREVTEFCKKGIIEAQHKLWGQMPDNPHERRQVDESCGCRLVKYLLVAFTRELMDDGRYFVRLSEIPVADLPNSVLFQGTSLEQRLEFIQKALGVEEMLGGGDGATIQFLKKSLQPEATKGN